MRVYRYICRGKWQVTISCAIGIIGVILSFTQKRHGAPVLLTFGSFFAFLIGVAAVTILVNSITVALLLYYFQSAQAGRNYYYDKFRDAAETLRTYLDSLHEYGIISSDYDESYRSLELLTMEDLPVGWKETFIPFLEDLFSELRDNLAPGDEYEQFAGRIQVKATVLNEAVSGLWVNLIQRVNMRSWVTPVAKSFWTLALAVISVIIGAIYFAGASAHILSGLAIAVGCMTILLILEIGYLAIRESKEFFDDQRDIDHGSQSEAPPA